MCLGLGEHPSQDQLRAFATITGAPQEEVRSWFKSNQQDQAGAAVQSQGFQNAGASGSDSEILQQAASVCKGYRSRCTTTKKLSADDIATNKATPIDPSRPFSCTSGCGQSFRDKDDWNKHEKINRPQLGYVCNLDAQWRDETGQYCSRCNVNDPSQEHIDSCLSGRQPCAQRPIESGRDGRLSFRKYHFKQHFNNLHPNVPFDMFAMRLEFKIDHNFERDCGFCGVRLGNWQFRIDHIADHRLGKIEGGPWTMNRWQDPWVDSEPDLPGDHNKEDNREESDDDNDHGGRQAMPGEPCPEVPPEFLALTDHKLGDEQNSRPAHDGSRRPGQIQIHSFKRNESMNNAQELPIEAWPHVNIGNAIAPNVYVESHGLTFASELEVATVKRLGRGASSTVDEVRIVDGQPDTVARKKFPKVRSQAIRHMFLQEIKILMGLRHPHIVEIFSVATHEEEPFIILPLADGSLADFFSNAQTAELLCSDLQQQQLAGWVPCLAAGLAYMHSNDILHGDIKPSNMLYYGERIVFSDFGISSFASDTDGPHGSMTDMYAAPELARQGVRSKASDIFALGCVLVELVTVMTGKPTTDLHLFLGRNSSDNKVRRPYRLYLDAMVKWWRSRAEHLKSKECQNPTSQVFVSGMEISEDTFSHDPLGRPSAFALADRFPSRPCCTTDHDIVSVSPVQGQESMTSSAFERLLGGSFENLQSSIDTLLPDGDYIDPFLQSNPRISKAFAIGYGSVSSSLDSFPRASTHYGPLGIWNIPPNITPTPSDSLLDMNSVNITTKPENRLDDWLGDSLQPTFVENSKKAATRRKAAAMRGHACGKSTNFPSTLRISAYES